MDPNERLHHDWMGMAQPEGLVLTVAALKAAEANITEPVLEIHAALRELAGERKVIADLRAVLRDVLGWPDDFVVAAGDLPPPLRVRLDGGELLAPTLALRSADDPEAFVLLVEETHRANLDAASDDRRWTATAHQRFERLLREAGVPAGLLTNGRDFRLVYAPRQESAGWITFRLADLLTVDGRPLLGAFHMLLNERRLLSLEEGKRLGALLRASREYQSTVSTRLQEQVLRALSDLIGGLQEADRLAEGRILRDWRRERAHLQEVYAGVVTVLMRMVFILYAEEKRLLPMKQDLYASHYSLSGLYAQLVADRGRHGDALDDRYGAWGRLITLFRLLHDGARAAGGRLDLSPRKGTFFNPDVFPFLEGRPRGSARQPGEILDLPRVSDGVVYRVLDGLLLLDGERLQYKGLEVEQLGSVYEGLMGFELTLAEGESMALQPKHVVVDLEALAKLPAAERLKRLKDEAELDLKDRAAGEVKAAGSAAELRAALARRASPRYAGPIAAGSLFLQPGEERRRTGSHYTPKKLTGPIVETALRPVLERLGPEPSPEAILELKVCDPAMGSGAFLVEACRQLAGKLEDAWRRTKRMPELPADEDPALHARRLIAQRCLYGVDKNPLAVDLARLSLWLETFAKDHPFTFVDHALRHGDSLVGLRPEQIASFSLRTGSGTQIETARALIAKAVSRAETLRRRIHAIADPMDNRELVQLWGDTEDALYALRLIGDSFVAAYFSHKVEKARLAALDAARHAAAVYAANGDGQAEIEVTVERLRTGAHAVPPFHWEIEFPEVFGRPNGGFDCIVGNPPFMGGTTIATRLGHAYHHFVMEASDQALGNADLVAFFLKKAFMYLRESGSFGLVATKTVAQGDTRVVGLESIIRDGGAIYSAQRRYKWPGEAAVIASIIHVIKGAPPAAIRLDGAEVDRITPFLFHGRVDGAPAALAANRGVSYVGSKIWGAGFVFEENPTNGSSSLEDMERILREEPRSREVISAYMGGEEFNASPTQSSRRYVIDFREMTQGEARCWPALFAIVEERVKPVRAVNKQRNYREEWWLHSTRVPEAAAYLREYGRILALTKVTKNLAVTFVRPGVVLADTIVLLLLHRFASFAIVQSRSHESWARFFASSMKDDLRYTPTDCFETFPFPPAYDQNPTLEAIGKEYYEYRADLMIKANEGLTKTYNRFHDPDETSPAIKKLRDLHARMDRAVLDAYGWTNIQPAYDFRTQLDESLRYTWADDTRDDVLARLLELNRVLAAEEAAAEAAQAAAPKPARKPAGKRRAKKEDQATLDLPIDPPQRKKP